MSMASAHVPYVIAAYTLAAGVLTLLAYWVLQADRKVRQQLVQWKSDAT